MTGTPLTVLPHPDPAVHGPTRGFVLVLAGGGYSVRAEHEYIDVTRWLSENGVACGYLDYAVAPATYPVALGQVLQALTEIRAGLHGPVTGPVAVLGFSAGAHLAGLALTATGTELALATSSREGSRIDLATTTLDDSATRPDAGVLCYPVVSMTDLPHLGSRANLLGDGADDTGFAKLLSIERRVDARTPPTFLWHTANDTVVDVEHSLTLARSLSRAHVPVELHVYPDGEHGLGLAGSSGAPAGWTAACLRWLAEQGIGPQDDTVPARAGSTP